MKKTLLFLLVFVMAASLLAGCKAEPTTSPSPSKTPTSQNPGTPTQNPTDDVEDDSLLENVSGYKSSDLLGEAMALPGNVLPSKLPLSDTPVEISVWTKTPNVKTEMIDFSDGEAWKELENRLNIKFKILSGSTTGLAESFMLHIASTDYADVMLYTKFYIGGIDKAVEDGVFVDLREWEEYMPHYMGIVESDPSFKRDAYTENGRLGHFCKLSYTEQRANANGMVYRKDMFEKVGLTEVPKTWDQWENMLVTVHDSLNMSGPLYINPTGTNTYNSAMLTGMGIVHDFFLRDGKVEFARTSPEYKYYVEKMADWWTKDLLYRDFYTRKDGDSGTALTELCCNDIIFSLQGWTADAGMHHRTITNVAVNPDFYISAVQDPIMNIGEKPISRYWGDNPLRFDSTTGWAITTGAGKNTEYAVRFVDYLFSTEGVFLMMYGSVEGEDYNTPDATYWRRDDGRPMLTKLANENENGLGMMDALQKYYFHVDEAAYLIQQRERDIFTEDKFETLIVWGNVAKDSERNTSILPPNATLTAEEGSRASTLLSDINTYVDETVLRFITGQLPLSEWDNYVAKIKTMSIDEVVGIRQSAVDRYFAKG